MSFLKSIFHCNWLLFCGLILSLLMFDVKICCISERHVQLCTVNLPPACYKFMLLNRRDCFPFVVYTTHGEGLIFERKSYLLKFCALSGGSWGDNKFARSQRLQARGRFCGMEQKKERIWNLSWEEDEGYTVPILSTNTEISLFNFYCWCVLLTHASWILYRENSKNQEADPYGTVTKR